MNLSYREMSIWLHIIIIGGIYGWYFAMFGSSISVGNVAGKQWLILMILATIAIVFAEAISQAILAMFNRRAVNQPSDERDRQIESTATRIAHYILIIGLCFGFSSIFVFDSPFVMFNVIFFFFILGELTGYIFQAISYRRAA
jgi:heme/copper-type cytochrome/quinol oxidase subunit 2